MHTFVTLDGVMQGPGGPDEDRTGGFERGGWVIPFAGTEFGEVVEGWMARTTELLFGRTTYEVMAGFWPGVTDPGNTVATTLNAAPKHVVSTTLGEGTWHNTRSIISGNIEEEVGALKNQAGGELQLHGSCGLVHTLHDAGLIDEYRIITVPVVVGGGKRLFEPGARSTGFDLVDHRTAPGGLVYQALRPAPLRSANATVGDDGTEVHQPIS